MAFCYDETKLHQAYMQLCEQVLEWQKTESETSPDTLRGQRRPDW